MDITQLYMDVINIVYSNKYLHALVVFVLFFIAARVLVWISEMILLKITSKTEGVVDDLLIKKVNKPLSLILLLVGVRISAVILELSESAEKIIYEIDMTLIIFVVTYIIIVVTDIIIDHWGTKWASRTKSTLDDQLIGIFHRFSKMAVSLIGLLFILRAWGVQIGPFLASIGILGIAVAFALQTTLGNIFGGVSIILDKTIQVGDVIELDKETRGTVMDVGLRATKIKTFDNEVIIIPNGLLANSKIQNWVPPDPSVRAVIPFSVAYGSDIEKVKKIVLKELEKIENLKKDQKPQVMFIEMTDSGLKFNAYFYVNSYEKRFAAKDQANTLIYNALNKNKISIPFPQLDIHIKKK